MSNIKWAKPKWIALILCVLSLSLLNSCISTQTGTRYESRQWNLSYEENVLVNTEPQGAKVYCQDKYIGISPIRFNANCGEKSVSVSQNGTYPVSWTEEPGGLLLLEIKSSSKQRTGSTNWKGDLQFSLTGGQWIIKAFKDGYEPATYHLNVASDNVFKQACQGVKLNSNDQLSSNIVGNRSILLTLKPLQKPSPVREPKPKQQQQQQQQQQTVVIPGSEQEKLGKVIITSNVENAEVFVDGFFVANTPANLKLKDGIHIIEVKKNGYKNYKRELRVLGDSEIPLRAELKKE